MNEQEHGPNDELSGLEVAQAKAAVEQLDKQADALAAWPFHLIDIPAQGLQFRIAHTSLQSLVAASRQAGREVRLRLWVTSQHLTLQTIKEGMICEATAALFEKSSLPENTGVVLEADDAAFGFLRLSGDNAIPPQGTEPVGFFVAALSAENPAPDLVTLRTVVGPLTAERVFRQVKPQVIPTPLGQGHTINTSQVVEVLRLLRDFFGARGSETYPVELRNERASAGSLTAVRTVWSGGLVNLDLNILPRNAGDLIGILPRLNAQQTSYHLSDDYQMFVSPSVRCIIARPKAMFPPVEDLLEKEAMVSLTVETQHLESCIAKITAQGDQPVRVLFAAENPETLTFAVPVNGGWAEVRYGSAGLQPDALEAEADEVVMVERSDLRKLTAVQQGWVELAVLDRLVRTYQPTESADIRTFIARLSGGL